MSSWGKEACELEGVEGRGGGEKGYTLAWTLKCVILKEPGAQHVL